MGRGRLWVVGVVLAVLLGVALLLHVLPLGGGPSGGGPWRPPVSRHGSPSAQRLVRLSSLAGSLVCLGGGEITAQLWRGMRDYNASSPVVKPYVDWLREALAPEPGKALYVPWYPRYRYWWIDNGYWWRLPEPGGDSVVRIGVVRLPFGGALIVTAFQDSDGRLVVVVHGTIVNQTGWKELLVRVGAFLGGLKWYANHIRVGWALWRIMLRGSGSYLEAGGEKIPVKQVVVLLEMPAYTVNETGTDEFSGEVYRPWYWLDAEEAYWDIIGHPALALAVRLVSPPHPRLVDLYTRMVGGLTSSTVLTGVKYPPNYRDCISWTPFLLRIKGCGICDEQTRATLMFATNAMGALTAYIAVDFGGGHALSVMLHTDMDTIDTDGDGFPDAKKLVDTAHLSPQYIDQELRTGHGDAFYEPPLLYTDPPVYGARATNDCFECYYRYMHGYFYSGIAYAVLRLPDWLKAPWLGYAIQRSNFTAVEKGAWANTTAYAARMSRMEGVSKLLDKLMPSPVYMVPPSMALGLNKTLPKLPVAYAAATPGLRYPVLVRGTVLVVGWGAWYRGSAVLGGDNVTVLIHYKPVGFVMYNITVYINGTKVYHVVRHQWLFPPLTIITSRADFVAFVYRGRAYAITLIVREEKPHGPPPPEKTVNATIRLHPVYVNVTTPWGRVPEFTGYVGTSVAGGSEIRVEARLVPGGKYSVRVLVNGTRVFRGETGLPARLVFIHGRTLYRLVLVTPAPPVINKTVEPVLVPAFTMPVQLPNGTVVNITYYRVNETFRLGNTTLVVFGLVSRLSVSLTINVYGVPPGNYTVETAGLRANRTTIESGAALGINIQYMAPRSNGHPHPVPAGTRLEITIQPLDLTIKITVKG